MGSTELVCVRPSVLLMRGRGRSGQCVALVSTGSLNPVHVAHVRMLEIAAAHLQAHGHNVVAAWLSPSDAAWSHGKAHGCMANKVGTGRCIDVRAFR